MSHVLAVALRSAPSAAQLRRRQRAPQGDGILAIEKGPGKTGAFDFSTRG
jgi:hypothetical protein